MTVLLLLLIVWVVIRRSHRRSNRKTRSRRKTAVSKPQSVSLLLAVGVLFLEARTETPVDSYASKALLTTSILFFVIAFALLLFKSSASVNRKRIAASASPLEDVDTMEGHDFEYYCAELLHRNGFTKIEVTPGSNDQGVDIVAWKDGFSYAIQCKRYNNKLGNKPVQEVVAGRAVYGCSRAAVMTNNYFTDGAIEAAYANDVVLWDRDDLERMQLGIKA